MNINNRRGVYHSRSSTTHHHERAAAISSQDPTAVNRRSASPDPRRRLIAAQRGHRESARSPRTPTGSAATLKPIWREAAPAHYRGTYTNSAVLHTANVWPLTTYGRNRQPRTAAISFLSYS